jgi:predicted DNA binding CopG/RHH family protein
MMNHDPDRTEAEEQALIDSVEAGQWHGVAEPVAAIAALAEAARRTGRKDSRVNIRLDSHDLRRLRIIALREGLPYQTLLGSILHKFATGQLVERPDERQAG